METIQIQKLNVIPEITDPLGKYWEQPKISDIVLDDKYALMTKTSFNKLPNYSMSQPTGVYGGKMWKSGSDMENIWYLKWWSSPDENDMCKGNVREILIIE